MQLAEQRLKRAKARRVPSRRELLDAANTAMSRGKVKAALAHYLSTMEHHGPDPTIDAKVAALYAKLRRLTRAREHAGSASTQFRNAGFQEKALAVYRNAASSFPHQIEFWQEIIDLQRAQGRKADAVNTLLEARKAFRGRALRSQAACLLEQLIELEPQNHKARLELAVLSAKLGKAEEARESLEALAASSRNGQLRRVRGAQFRLSPTPATAWRWLRAALLGR
jgi:tetratricopeptide (TPR) repeat protein